MAARVMTLSITIRATQHAVSASMRMNTPVQFREDPEEGNPSDPTRDAAYCANKRAMQVH